MRALMYDGPNEMHVTDLPEPQPGPGEVRLTVEACGICGSDVHGYTGESGRRTAGQVMGHEFAGTVAALGEGVEGWEIGQRVAAYNMTGCGQCVFCQAGNEQCCPQRKVVGVNMGLTGAFAESVTVPARNLAKLADDVPYAEALLNEPLAVSYHALRHVPDDAKTLAIVGGGTIGQCLARVALMLGRFGQVVVSEPMADKRAMVEAVGAKAVAPDQLDAQFDGGADAAIEAVGVAATVQAALQAVRPAGTLVLLGNLAKEVPLPLQHITSAEKTLVGSYGFNLADFRQVVEWINAGRFELAPMVSGTCTLEEAPEVFADLAAGRRQAVKLVVQPQEEVAV